MPSVSAAIRLEHFSTFGDLLKYLRRRAGLTQRELSIAVGYSGAQISRLEQNHRPPDRATLAARFVPALGLDEEPAIVARLMELAGRAPTATPAAAPPFTSQPASAGSAYALFDRMQHGPLVGREREMGQAVAAWNRAAAGDGSTLLVSGEPGIGKSRLVRELARWSQAAGARVLAGDCFAEGAPPYAPQAQVLRQVFEDTARDPDLPAYVLADLLRLAPNLAPRFPNLPLNPTLDAEFERERLFESFVTWCITLTQRAPLLLVVEDVHWADDGTLLLLRHLARRGRQSRLLMVITFRDAEVALDQAGSLRQVLLDFSRERLAQSLSLPRLNRDETGSLLAALLAPGQIGGEVVDSIFRETEGNPFFVEEVCKGLLEEERLYEAGGTWHRRDPSQTVLATSGHAAILSRVERLPHPCQETLQLAAIIGRGFDFEVLKAAGAQDEDTLIGSLERAERALLVAEERQAGRLRFQFAHALIPFALSENLGQVRRQRIHQRVAAALEAKRPDDFEALAHHFAAAGERHLASAYARRAGERAAALYDYQTALEHQRAALALLELDPPDQARLALLEQIADLQSLCGEQVEAIVTYQAALALWRHLGSEDRWTAVRLYRKASEALYRASHTLAAPLTAAVRAGLEDALTLVEGQPPHLETVHLWIALANDAYWRSMIPGETAVAIEPLAQAAIELAEQLDRPVELSAGLGALDRDYSSRGLYRERLQVAQRRLALSRDARFGDARERVSVLNQAALALQTVGEFSEGLPLAFEAEALAAQIRDVSGQANAMQLQSQCFFGLDRWDETLEVENRRKALEAEYGVDLLDRMCYYCGINANVMGWRGDYEEAGARRQESFDFMARVWGRQVETWPAIGHY
jgi:hypothetical protein